jgi:hypothetical protein
MSFPAAHRNLSAERVLCCDLPTSTSVQQLKQCHPSTMGNLYMHCLLFLNIASCLLQGVRPPHSDNPGSLACARAMRTLGQKAWREYIGPDMVALSAHLMAYPVEVAEDGSVGAIPGQETFPDVGGKVVGSKTKIPLPPVLTG